MLGDMKLGVVMVAIGDFIFMLLGLDLVLYILLYFTFYMSHYLGSFVLYSRCRVNRDTNMCPTDAITKRRIYRDCR